MSQCVGDPQRVMLALSVTMEWQQSCSGPLTLKAVWHSIRAWLVASKICIQTRLCAICLPMEEDGSLSTILILKPKPFTSKEQSELLITDALKADEGCWHMESCPRQVFINALGNAASAKFSHACPPSGPCSAGAGPRDGSSL